MDPIAKKRLILIYIFVLLLFAFMTFYATDVINEANSNKLQATVSTQRT